MAGATFDAAYRFLNRKTHGKPLRNSVIDAQTHFYQICQRSNAVRLSKIILINVHCINYLKESARRKESMFSEFVDSLNWIPQRKQVFQVVRIPEQKLREAAFVYTGDINDPAEKIYSSILPLDMLKN